MVGILWHQHTLEGLRHAVIEERHFIYIFLCLGLRKQFSGRIPKAVFSIM